MSTILPFNGKATLWIDGNRISIGLEARGLSKGTRVSTKIEGKVGQELLALILNEQLMAVAPQLNKMGFNSSIEGPSVMITKQWADESWVRVTCDPNSASSDVVVSAHLDDEDRTALQVLRWAEAVLMVCTAMGWKSYVRADDMQLRELITMGRIGNVSFIPGGLQFHKFADAKVYLADTSDVRYAFIVRNDDENHIAAALYCREYFDLSSPIIVDAQVSERRVDELMVEQIDLLEDTELTGADLEISAVVRISGTDVEVFCGTRTFRATMKVSTENALQVSDVSVFDGLSWRPASTGEIELLAGILRPTMKSQGFDLPVVFESEQSKEMTLRVTELKGGTGKTRQLLQMIQDLVESGEISIDGDTDVKTWMKEVEKE